MLAPAVLAIVVFVVAAGTPSPVRGAIRTWDGGGADNLWTNPLNWSSDLVPGAADSAIFDGTSLKDATINANVSVLGLAFNAGYTGTITQAPGNTLTVGASAFAQADGTFSGGTAAITGNGAFTLSGGSFTSTTGTLTVTGAFTKSGGTFAHNGGTVAFSTSSVTIDLGGTETFNNVSFLSATKTIAAGTTLVVTGTLNLAGGTINTGTLAAQGAINAQLGFTGGGTATLLINGAADQTFTGFHTTAAGSLPHVTIDKPSGTLTIAGTLRTARNWTYTGGTVDPGTSTLVFNGTLTISGDHALNDVELLSGTVTVTPGDTLTVDGMLTLTNGNLNGGTIASLGDISLAAAFDGETGTLRIAGTADQTWTGAANTTSSDMANVVIDKPSGTLFLVGAIRLLTASWTWLQGAMDPGTSTVYFDTTVTITGTHSLYNVYLSGGAHTVTGGDTLTALGTLTLDNGTINGGTIAAAGDLAQLSTFDGGTGLLRVIGTGNQTFDGFATIGAGNLPAFEIEKPSGILTLSGTIRTTNDWTHISGTLDPDASLVVFSTGLTIDAAGMTFADIQVTSGTAALASDLNVGGNLFVSGGTLNAAGTTVTVGGDVTIDGAFTPGTGLLDMNGVAPQTLGGAAASISLYDFSVNNAAGVTITTDVSVAGTLTLNGPLDISGQTLGIANAIAGTPTDLTGDPLSSLVVSGTGAGIVIPSSLPVLANLTLDNPNGAALAAPLTIGSLLTLTDGVLDAGAWVVVIDPAASVARTAGHVSGALQKTIPLGAGVAVTFEIGDATTYAPVSLLFGMVSGSGTITASTTAGEHPNIGSSVIDPAQDVNRWWSLVNSGVVFDTLDATFTFDPADVDPGASTAAFVVAKWDGAWVLPASGAALPTSITAFGMTSLSEFAVGEVESGDLPDTAQGTPIGLGTLLIGVGLLGLVVFVMRRTRSLAVVAHRG